MSGRPERRLEVLDPGPQTSVQDAAGRVGSRRYGVPQGGAADRLAARLANRLVGNPDAAALLEATGQGPRLRFASAAVVGVAGADLGITVDGRPLPPGSSARVREGAVIASSGRRDGARAYLAVDGGIVVQAVLGSASTDLRSGFGGLDGRALGAGDLLSLGPAGPTSPRRARPGEPGPLRVLGGPHPHRFAADALERLVNDAWRVSDAADRAGVRLDGPPLAHAAAAELASMALPEGAVQVPPDGRPIVMLADRPVTGGYPVVACVIAADVGRAAQLLPGDEVRFALVTIEEARVALDSEERRLAELEPIDDPDSAWAGALE